MIRTQLTQILGIDCPLLLAPMGGVAGGVLAAEVSNAGGLGVVGGGYSDRDWLQRELELVTRHTSRPWGVGFITWYTNQEVVDLALSYRPKAVILSFGNPQPYVAAIKRAGSLLICQVQDVETAREAKTLGADILVAQGTEAGGHGNTQGTLPLVPAIVDAVYPTPVVAAGGIADGRGVAAALALGATGALLGTAFCVAEESLLHPHAKQRLVTGRASHTVRTRIFDTVRGYSWPQPFTGRALRNAFLEKWHNRDADLEHRPEEFERYRRATREGDYDTALVWAGEGVDLINRIEPAAAIMRRIDQQARICLRGVASLVE